MSERAVKVDLQEIARPELLGTSEKVVVEKVAVNPQEVARLEVLGTSEKMVAENMAVVDTAWKVLLQNFGDCCRKWAERPELVGASRMVVVVGTYRKVLLQHLGICCRKEAVRPELSALGRSSSCSLS
jgi:hypothetical protein